MGCSINLYMLLIVLLLILSYELNDLVPIELI